MSIATSARIAASVLALAIAVRPMEAQQKEKAVRVPKAVLERYVGEYVYPSGATIVVRLRGDTLIRQAWNQEAMLTPVSQTRFNIGGAGGGGGNIGLTAEFVTDASGGVATVISNEVGEIFRTPRKPLTAASAPKAPPPGPQQGPGPGRGGGPGQGPGPGAAPGIAVSPTILERYIGAWKTPAGNTVTFRRDGATLFVKVGANPEAPLAARSETRLQDPRGPIFEFQVDATGAVTGLILEQGQPIQRVPLTRAP